MVKTSIREAPVHSFESDDEYMSDVKDYLDSRNESNTSRREKWVRRIKKLIAKTALAASLLAPVSAAAGEYYGHDPLMIPRHVADLVVGNDGQYVPQEKVAEMEQLLSSPVDQDRTNKSLDIDIFTQSEMAADGHAAEYRESQRSYSQFYAERAEKYGLQVVDPMPFIDRLQDAGDVNDVKQILSDYGDEIGVRITIPDTRDIRDIGMDFQVVNSSDVNMQYLRDRLNRLLAKFSAIPKEIFHYSQLDELRVVQTFGDVDYAGEEHFQPSGEANVFSGISYVALDMIGHTTFQHELGHRIDYVMNGMSGIGMTYDQQYLDLNPEEFHYGSPDNYSKTVVVGPHVGWIEEVHYTADSYGTSNIWEDKATVLEHLLSQQSAGGGKNEEVVREKAALLLARLDQAVSGSALYLLDTAGLNI